jgi:hypothetical protein
MLQVLLMLQWGRGVQIGLTSLLPSTKLMGRFDDFLQKLDAATFPHTASWLSLPPHDAACSPRPPPPSQQQPWGDKESHEAVFGRSPVPLVDRANPAGAAQVLGRRVWPGGS